MSIDALPQTPPSLWRRLSTLEKLAAIAGVLVSIYGVSLIGHGLYLKAKAELSQIMLAQSFSNRLQTGAEARPWPWAAWAT